MTKQLLVPIGVHSMFSIQWGPAAVFFGVQQKKLIYTDFFEDDRIFILGWTITLMNKHIQMYPRGFIFIGWHILKIRLSLKFNIFSLKHIYQTCHFNHLLFSKSLAGSVTRIVIYLLLYGYSRCEGSVFVSLPNHITYKPLFGPMALFLHPIR